MKSRCKYCGKYWNISIKQQIPKTGYECPKCTTIKRNSTSDVKISKKIKRGGKTNVQKSL